MREKPPAVGSAHRLTKIKTEKERGKELKKGLNIGLMGAYIDTLPNITDTSEPNVYRFRNGEVEER